MRNLLAFIIGLFLVAIFIQVDFFFYLLYFFFGVYFLSLWWTDRVLKRVTWQREYIDRAFAGDRIRVSLSVKNDSWLPMPWLRLHESLPIQLSSPNFFRGVVSLLPHEERHLEYELNCRRRGYYGLGPLTLSTGDLFGMRALEQTYSEANPLLVYPQIVPLEQIHLDAQSPFGDMPSRQRLMEDPARMLGVRPYQSGDSLRHIHWKTSAVRGELQTKRFEPAISVEAQILLNLCRGDYSPNRYVVASELAIETAASIANYLIDKRQSVGLCCTGGDAVDPERASMVLPPHKGQGQMMQILDLLARVELREEVDFAADLRQARLQLGWGGTAIVITPDLTDGTYSTLLMLRRMGLYILLVLVDPQTPFAQVQAKAEQAGIETQLVWREKDLDVWR